jgi:hypothetical protein
MTVTSGDPLPMEQVLSTHCASDDRTRELPNAGGVVMYLG